MISPSRVGRLKLGVPPVHATLTVLSMSLGYYGGKNLTAKDDEKEEVFDANHYKIVTELVTSMYGGHGVNHQHCELADSITFEDPAAICQSPKEVQEAFRVFKLLKPKSIMEPKCIDVEPRGSSIGLTYALHQHYGLLSLKLRSHLFVKVELIHIKNSSSAESEFLITRFEERWNGIIPQSNYVLWISRRINGILSWYITRNLL